MSCDHTSISQNTNHTSSKHIEQLPHNHDTLYTDLRVPLVVAQGTQGAARGRKRREKRERKEGKKGKIKGGGTQTYLTVTHPTNTRASSATVRTRFSAVS